MGAHNDQLYSVTHSAIPWIPHALTSVKSAREMEDEAADLLQTTISGTYLKYLAPRILPFLFRISSHSGGGGEHFGEVSKGHATGCWIVGLRGWDHCQGPRSPSPYK
jgi:hypothetical protein